MERHRRQREVSLYLSKEHSFIDFSLRQGHCPPKSLKVKISRWSDHAVQLQDLKNSVLEEVLDTVALKCQRMNAIFSSWYKMLSNDAVHYELNTNLRCNVSSCLHECHLCWALDGPEGVYEGPESARHRPHLQHGSHVRLVQPGVGGLRAIVPQQSAWQRIQVERKFATRCQDAPGFEYFNTWIKDYCCIIIYLLFCFFSNHS